MEAFNANGALVTARAWSPNGSLPAWCMMYHAQEKIVNVPGSEVTGMRGGIHNSVTRAVLKPTHMIGGYAQLSYGLNYYGTVGSNRDEFIIVRKMNKVDWLDGTAATRQKETCHEGPRTDRVVLNLDKCIGFTLAQVTSFFSGPAFQQHRIPLVQQHQEPSPV